MLGRGWANDWRYAAARREALLDELQGRLRRWFAPIPSQAGLHLAARIDPAADARAVFDALRRHAPGAQTAAEYSLQADAPSAAVFGYAVIDAGDIREALARLARSLSR